MDDDFRKLTRRKLGVTRTLKAIGWGMLGLRRGQGREEDFQHINPVVLILAALIATLVFVLGLIAIARWLIILNT